MAFGPDLVTNGNFNGGTSGWVVGAAATYLGDNKLTVIDGLYTIHDDGFIVSQDISIVQGNYYLVSLRLTGTSGRISVFMGDNETSGLPNQFTTTTSSARTIQFVLQAAVSSVPKIEIYVTTNNDMEGVTIDYVSVRQINLSDLRLGSEQVTNGSFSGSADGWTLNTGWAYGSNNIVHTPGNAGQARSDLSIPNDGSQYLLSYTLAGSGGFVYVGIDDGLSYFPITPAYGVTTLVIQQLFSDIPVPFNVIDIFPDTAFAGTITSVSLKKIEIPSNLYLQNVFMVGANTDGDVMTFNVGKSDNEIPIYYELETQDIELGNRSHLKQVSNQIAIFTRFGAQSNLQAKSDMFPYKDIPLVMSDRVNIGDKIDLTGHWLTFKWFGSSTTVSPVFEGIYLEDVNDFGITHG